jgi:hypothetical protein
MKNRKKQMAFAGGSFIVGFAVGVATSEYFKRLCRESLNSERADAIRELKNQQKEFMAQVNHKLSDFRERVRKEFHEPIPNLYKATEGLSLDAQDVEIEH